MGIYEYDFIPLNSQEPIFVRRLDTDGRPTYTRYDSPYVDLPRIKSHAHPFFVLYASYHQIAIAPDIDLSMERLGPIMEVNQMWFFKVPSEFHTLPKNETAVSAPPPPQDHAPRSADASPVRGVKRPHADDDEDDEDNEDGCGEADNTEEEDNDEDDDDDGEEESSIMPTTTPPASDSIRTPKDASTPPSPPCKRLKLDLSVLSSDMLYNSSSLLRWIGDARS